MLYGYPLPVGLPDSVATPKSLQVQRLEATNRTNHLACILQNRHAHGLIPYPSNPGDLPDVLCNRVVTLMLEAKNRRRQQKDKGVMSEKEESRYTDKLQPKLIAAYAAMAQDIGKAAGALFADRQDSGKGYLTYKHYHKVLSAVIADKHHQAGHCGEYSGIVVANLLGSYDSARIRLLKGDLGPENNHICVVVDAGNPADVSDGAAYGPNAMVCDPWLDLVAEPSEYFRVLDKIDCPFAPTELASLKTVIAGQR